MPRQRRSQKVQKKEKLIWHYCRECQFGKVKTYESVKSVICSYCMQRLAGMPETPDYLKPASGKPRGWHFKKYFEHEGVVYSRGEEITDKKLIKELKAEYGKAEPQPKKKTTKRKKNADTSK